MFRTLTAASVLLALSTFALAPAQAQTAASAPARKVAAKKPAKAEPVPVPATNDDLNPNQLSLADRVLTGVADCEFKEKVDVEKIPGHSGNFKVTYEHKTYTMVPEETTTGAIRLVDLTGAVVWIQIPMKSMLMNQKEHHRLVDGCQEDEQRIAVQASQKAGANAGVLAPNVASPAAVAAANGLADAKAANAAAVETAPPGSTVTTTSTTVTTTRIVPTAPTKNATGPAAAASGMWK